MPNLHKTSWMVFTYYKCVWVCSFKMVKEKSLFFYSSDSASPLPRIFLHSCIFHEKTTSKGGAVDYFHMRLFMKSNKMFMKNWENNFPYKNVNTNRTKIQQSLEIHGLEEHGPWRYTVFNWISKHLRYTVLGQKPWRCTVFLETHDFWSKALKMHGF